MKKIIGINFILSGLLLTTTTTSCFEAGNDPFVYLPKRISGDWNNLINKAKPVIFKNNDEQVVDYSPLLIDALKSFGSDKFEKDKYFHLVNQFFDEFTYYSHFSEVITFNYENQTLKDAPILKSEDQIIAQIIRISNYNTQPISQSNKIHFENITLEKYTFEYTSDTVGKYVKANDNKKINDIYINGIDLDELLSGEE